MTQVVGPYHSQIDSTKSGTNISAPRTNNRHSNSTSQLENSQM